MKRTISIIAAAMLAFVPVFAQGPGGFPGGGFQGGPRGQRPEGQRPEEPRLSVEEIVQNRTAEMIQKYTLNDAQAAQLTELNNRYAGKIQSLGAANAMRDQMPNFAEMSQEERQQMMNDMANRMEEMQNRMAEMQQNESMYEEGLKAIFDKKQLKTYAKDKKREQMQQQQRMRGQFERGFGGGGFPGGGGGFPGGGGFGGPGGGGFGGPGRF